MAFDLAHGLKLVKTRLDPAKQGGESKELEPQLD